MILDEPDVLAFLPDVPAVAGHTLVVPRAHVETIWNLNTATAAAIAVATLKVAQAVRHAVGLEGLNVIQSNGTAAGQTVPHVHVHVVPRTRGDRMGELWPPDKGWTSAELDSMQTKLRQGFTQN